MVYENINIKLDNCCFIDGIYYYIDVSLNALVSKSSGGNILFTYPIFIQVETAPLKFDFDGVYFFSLHLESNRNLIRKWRLVNYVLIFVQEYDYSSIGLLASSSTVFIKYFYMPIEYDGWEEGYIGTVSNFIIINNELTVEVFGYTASYIWKGPKITKYFDDVSEFKFDLKFRALDAENETNYKILIYFYDDTTQVLTFQINLTSCKLTSDGTEIFYSELQLLDNTYVVVELYRSFQGGLGLKIDDAIIYSGVATEATFNNIVVSIQRYRTYTYQSDFRINSCKLHVYENEHVIDTNTLVIDSYKSTVASGTLAGSTYIELVGEIDYIESGTVLFLGDTNSQTYEEVTVTGTLGLNKYGINFFTYFDHEEGEDVSFSKNFYIFNNYRRTVPGGSIYKLNYVTGYVEETYDSDSYVNINAACFFYDNSTYLCGYVSNTNFLMLDIHDNMNLFEAMNIENVESDQITIIPVTDIEVTSGSLYRIQKSVSYYGLDYNWTNYNFQMTPIRSFIDSTTIEAKPLIVNADGISVVDVKTLAKDQYAEEIISIKVKFYEDDDVGYMTIRDTYTGITGKAQSYYKSGITPREVLLSTEIIQE